MPGPGGVSGPRGVCSWGRCLVWAGPGPGGVIGLGDVWSGWAPGPRGGLLLGGLLPGGVPGPVGLVSQHALRQTPRERRLLLQTVCILLECILVCLKRLGLCVFSGFFFLINYICLTSLTRAKWSFPLNFRTMRKLSDLYSVHYA